MGALKEADLVVEQMNSAVDFLSHYGVKGMKWGKRNGEVPANATRAQRKAANKESKLAYKDWKKEVGGEKVANEIYQEATKSFGPAIKVINNDPAFKGKDMTKTPRLARQYDQVISQTFNDHLAAASINRTMTNTGRAMLYQFDRNVGMMRATEVQAVFEHADDAEYPEFVAEMDELGQIISLKRADEDPFLEQMDAAADFLSHYGVKGMKWGKRKSGAVKEAPSEDAARVGNIHGRVKTQKTTRMLSNKELQDAITRMNLEQQYSRMTGGLDKTKRQKASAFLSEMVQTIVKGTVKEAANSQVKDAIEKKTKTGKHDPLAIAKRDTELAKLRTQQNGGQS